MILSPTKDGITTIGAGNTALYTAFLPDSPISLATPKTVSVDRTISGGASISVWAASMAGEVREVSFLLESDKYVILNRISSSEVDEWILRVQGRIFLVIPVIRSAQPELTGQKRRWRVSLEITFVSEETE